jgi:hypothetical protein
VAVDDLFDDREYDMLRDVVIDRRDLEPLGLDLRRGDRLAPFRDADSTQLR